jgi:hypothetical protein
MEAPMADLKMKVRIGQNEFEAEGPQEIVEKHFETFSRLLSQPQTPASTVANKTGASDGTFVVPESTCAFAKVFHQEGKRISLIGRFDGIDRELDAALLILFGHKELRGADAVSADELLYGLNQTGYTLERADRLMKRGREKGLLNFSGVRRGTKYRLTLPGIARAKELGKELQDMFQIVP